MKHLHITSWGKPYQKWSRRRAVKLYSDTVPTYLYLHCTENPIYVFPEMKLRGLVHNSYIHLSVRVIYIPRIGTPIWLQQNAAKKVVWLSWACMRTIFPCFLLVGRVSVTCSGFWLAGELENSKLIYRAQWLNANIVFCNLPVIYMIRKIRKLASFEGRRNRRLRVLSNKKITSRTSRISGKLIVDY